jgi:hypothetical protein
VLGDFNLIYKARDKNNLNLNRQLMGKFRHALNDCELFEFSLQNCKSTWRNERAEKTLIRLDRVFCNTEWELLHTGFKRQKPCHCRSVIIVRLYYVMKKDQGQEQFFRFENFCTRVPGYKDVVMEAWHGNTPSVSPLNILFYKLQ